MGCCFSTSTPRGKRHPQPQNDGRKPPPESAGDDRAPPPSVEQECVKEVLSETPLPNLRPDQTHKTPVVPDVKIEAEEKIEEVVVEVSSRSQVSEMCSVSEVSQSQVSEMCSVSESFSTATEKRDDEVASKPTADPAQRVTRSPAKVPRKRVYSAGARGRLPKSPAGKTEPSPEKKGQAAAQSRLRQQSVGYGGVRRDHGEGSGRRSRSPATRGAGGAGRGGVGKSPVKQAGRAGGKLQNVGDVRSQSKSNKEEAQNGTVEQKIENESLENPHVSLECFIFL